MELEPKIINVDVKKDNGDFVVYSVKFQYVLLDSLIPTNLFTVKFNSFDHLDTHDTFNNYLGFRYNITEHSKID